VDVFGHLVKGLLQATGIDEPDAPYLVVAEICEGVGDASGHPEERLRAYIESLVADLGGE
jgi:hypothetical protein